MLILLFFLLCFAFVYQVLGVSLVNGLLQRCAISHTASGDSAEPILEMLVLAAHSVAADVFASVMALDCLHRFRGLFSSAATQRRMLTVVSVIQVAWGWQGVSRMWWGPMHVLCLFVVHPNALGFGLRVASYVSCRRRCCCCCCCCCCCRQGVARGARHSGQAFPNVLEG